MAKAGSVQSVSSEEWRIICDALGVAMVATWGNEEPLIPCDFENEEYENLQAKLAEMGLVDG